MESESGVVFTMFFVIVIISVFTFAVINNKHNKVKKLEKNISGVMCVIKSDYVRNYDLICVDNYLYLKDDKLLSPYQSANSHCSCKK